MVYDIIISDGTNEVTLSPGATLRRTIDTTEGYVIIDRPNQEKPRAKDIKIVRNKLEIQTTFGDRRTDYDKLFKTMIAERTRGAEFTLTIQRKTGDDEVYTVIPYPSIIDQRDPGTGEMDNVTIPFLEVEGVD